MLTTVRHPFHIQHEDGRSWSFAAGSAWVPEHLHGHPLVLVNTDMGDNSISELSPLPLSSEPTRADLLAMAEELGVSIDKRWSVARIREAIEAAS